MTALEAICEDPDHLIVEWTAYLDNILSLMQQVPDMSDRHDLGEIHAGIQTQTSWIFVDQLMSMVAEHEAPKVSSRTLPLQV